MILFYHRLVRTKKPQKGRSFLNLVEKAVAHEGDSDTWEFGKAALSELRFCGLAVKRGKRLEVGGWRLEAEGKISNVKAQMPNGKIQMEKSLGKRKNEL